MSNLSTPLKRIRGLSVFSFMLSIYILCLVLQTINPALRYAKYVLPFIAAIDFIAFRNSRKLPTHLLREYFQPHLYMYFFLVVCSFFVCLFKNLFKDDRLYLRFFQESYFLFAPLIFVSIIYFVYVPSKKDQYAKYLFWGLLIAYFFETGPSILSVLANLGSLSTALNNSTVSTESVAAFPIGLFFLYFLFGGDKIYSLISLIFTILSFKRVVLLGVIISLTLYLVLSILKLQIHRYKNYTSILLMGINFLLVYIVIQVANGNYDELIFNNTGLSANAFLMGRQHLYSKVLKVVDDYSWLGGGLGKTWAVLDTNLHSDVLKNFIEFGSGLFFLWSFLIYRFNTKTIEMFVLTIYLNVLFLTDNVIIYFDTMFVFYLLQGFLLSKNFIKR